MKILKIFLILFMAVMTHCFIDDEISPGVKTPLGIVRGFWQLSRDGRQFQAYEGIPYAQPPVGKLRFEAPKRINAWIGELPATKPGSMCLQYLHIVTNQYDRVTGTEDCLYLNVYTPVEASNSSTRNSASELLPVIVYIHSGAFQFGDGASHRPHYLMDHDVVLVTFNYRLGPLGFLSTQDSTVPGNMGLKDQSLALAWVAENIEAFGGDPKKVTITGLSAGAASVHYHYLSPMSRGLFQRGMSVSGTALDCWTQTEASVEKANKLGAAMGCPTDRGTKDLVSCLRTRPAKSIVEAEGKFMGWLYNPFTPFGPVVETDSTGAFIDKSPIDIISNGLAADLPWITGVVTEEGLYPAAEFINDEERMKQLDENWQLIAPYLLDYNYTIPKTRHAAIARKIREHYLGDKPIDEETATALIHMIGDRLYVVDAEKAARSQARVSSSPIRFYLFSYRGKHSLSDIFTGTKKNFGVSHADDLAYVFKDWNAALTDEQDVRMSRDQIEFWTSYAKTGIPEMGIEWPKVDAAKEELDYLRIAGPGKISIESNANLGDKNFWQSIDFNENKLPKNSVVQQQRRHREQKDSNYDKAAKNPEESKYRKNDWGACEF